jgi:SSS family solute:Na+ symporter
VTLGLAGFEQGYSPGSLLWIVNNIYFQYFSVLITIVSAIVMVVVSHATAEPDYDRMKGLVYGTATGEQSRQTSVSWSWREVVASAVVLSCIVGAYVYFRG